MVAYGKAAVALLSAYMREAQGKPDGSLEADHLSIVSQVITEARSQRRSVTIFETPAESPVFESLFGTYEMFRLMCSTVAEESDCHLELILERGPERSKLELHPVNSDGLVIPRLMSGWKSPD